MESGNGGASSKGFVVPVSDTSDVFQNNILAPLQSAYLYEESKQCFKYKSAVLVQNSALEKKYNDFRARKREAGYSEEDLKETYGFLLFDDVKKAHALGETGFRTGNGTCTTLGDPWKGVYISMYSDCLDPNRWYHGKSGYIAIIRLTKGRVKEVLENYTQNFTAPTEGFDCHVSEQLPSVSAHTSSFLAFERTQYYMYELLGDGSRSTAQSPSAACPFAIVSFSYTDTKAAPVAQQETSEEKKQVNHYLPWRGQLQIGSQLYNVALRSGGGALIPAKLPTLVKVDRAISMPDLIQLLPRSVFENYFLGEVFLDGLYCSLCELISSEAEETKSLSLLLQQIKEKDLAFPVPLNDGGFLILLHSSHFLTYDDTTNMSEVLQGMFVFPSSRTIDRGTKFEQRKATMSSEILRVLPVLSYAEGEVEKKPFDPSEELCEVFVQHMQNYAALINPGLALSPSRDLSIFPDQYDVPDAHKYLYSSPEWTDRAWMSFKSYMSKPVSFQIPVSKSSEILAAGQEERREDLDDDVYICLSSPEEAAANPVDMGSEDQPTDQKCTVNVETSGDSGTTRTEAQVEFTAVPHNIAADDLLAGDATKDNELYDLSAQVQTDNMGAENLLTPPRSDDLSAELIVSITSAEQTLANDSLSVISTVSATKENDFQLSSFSADKLQSAGAKAAHDETVKTKNKDCSDVTNIGKTKGLKLRRGRSRGLKNASKDSVETLGSQAAEILDDISMSQKDDQVKESSGDSKLHNPLKVDWRKLPRRKRKFGKLSSRNKKVRSSAVGLAVANEKKLAPGQQRMKDNILMELEVYPSRKKVERWDLKPVVSVCGRILVPFGTVDIAAQIKHLKDKSQCTNGQHHLEKTLDDASVNAPDKLEDSSTAPETAVDETEATTSKDKGIHLQNVVGSHINTDHRPQKQSDDNRLPLNPESIEHSSDTPPSETLTEKHTDTTSAGKCATKGEFLLSKLKSVLLRGKRKSDSVVSEGTSTDAAQNTEPCLKKGKDSDIEALKSNNEIVKDTNMGVKEVSKMQSVDILFAYALGLTPKEKPDKAQKSEGRDSQQRKDSSETQEQTILVKPPQIIQKPPSIYPRRGRIKTLKKHQGLSAEHIKKKWWLHFQSPACISTDKLRNKECTRDNSVRKTVKEKMNSACTSTDALNLLADLALSANNDQAPPQPDPALESNPETSLKKCDLTKDVPIAEQESVLHALLRQPAARLIQLYESPSPSGSELVDLISKEHAYSLPPSSPLLLGLPGTPFQVSPLSGSTRLLHPQQQLYGDGIQTLQPTVCQEDRGERNHRTPKNLKKHVVHRRKFRHSRTFVNKGSSVQVTRQWNERYDFNRDSKFSSDTKDRAIIRALHGPWDFSIQDTTEELRLIVHMWIGLFYSRSTPRFFHVDSNIACSKESESLEMSSEMVVAGPAQPELKGTSLDAFPSGGDTQEPSTSQALDLSKKDNSVVNQGSVILDLSLRNSSTEIHSLDPQVNKKETSVSGEQKEASETSSSLVSSMGQQGSDQTLAPSAENINEVNSVKNIIENERICSPLQKAGCLDYTDVPSFKVNEKRREEEKRSVAPLTENVQTTSGTDDMSNGCNKVKTSMKKTEHAEITDICLVQKHETDSSESTRDKGGESNKEADDVIDADEHGESKSKENLEVEENQCQEESTEPSSEVLDTGDDSTRKDPGVVCGGDGFENEKLLSGEEARAVPLLQAEDEYMNSRTGHQDGVIIGDYFGKENGLDEKDRCISAVAVDRDLSEQQLPVMCDSPDSVKKDCTPDYSAIQPPSDEQSSQTNNEEDACHDLQLRELHVKGSVLAHEHAVLEKAPNTQPEVEVASSEPAEEDNSQNEICSTDKAHCQTATLPIPDEKTCSLDGSCLESIPQTKDSLETGSQNTVTAVFNFGPSRDEAESGAGKEKDENTTPEEPHPHHSPQVEVVSKCGAEDALTKETNLKLNTTNTRLEKSVRGVVEIPFIGFGISGEDMVEPQIPIQQSKAEEAAQVKEEIPFLTETLPSDLSKEVCHASEMHRKKEGLPVGKISLLGVNETTEPEVLGSESDDRCPTPTLDERPYECIPGSGPRSSTLAVSGETYKNVTQKCLSRSSTPIMDEMSPEQKHHQSTVNSDPNPQYGFHPDLELRTLRVLQSIDKFLSESKHTGKSGQIETADMKNHLDQIPNLNSKPIPTGPVHQDKKSNSKPMVVSASTSQEMHNESSDRSLLSPFKSKIEEALGVKLQLQNTESPLPQHCFERTDKLQETSQGQDYCHAYTSLSSTECLQSIAPSIGQDRFQAIPQSSLIHEPRSYSQRPVMAVKPSKSDESQVYSSSKDVKIDYPPPQKNKTHTTCTTMPLEKTECIKENSWCSDEQESSVFSSRTSLSNDIDSKSTLDKAKSALLDASNQCQGKNNKISSSLSMQSFESEKSAGHQSFSACSLLQKVEQTSRENTETDQRDCSEASTSFWDHKDNNRVDDNLIVGPQTSLTCTIFNTSRKRPYCFLEQVSQRCLQDDITQVSMEQECLIFSEKMKQLLKRSKRGPICQQDSQEKQTLPCTSPVTVCFSGLEEQEDSLELSDAPSIVGQKIKVDVSDRKSKVHSTEEEMTSHPQKASPAAGNMKDHAGVSGVTAECSRLYETMMDDVCAVKKAPSRTKHYRTERGYKKTKPSNHFDFCDQMKKEVDESFRNNLNSVVKKLCRTKYRFYILVTSDDALFEKTKTQLEAEGHIAVQPSEFFLSSSPPLLIILRNEDIAEHICEVPHLLELKQSPGVQFAGIDEPDDVVNLTHQELFMRGGFIMFDRAALELLTICDMKKFSEILQELSRAGKWKWKWILHYRDSRRMKENARLSAEAKEKRNFLNVCQDAGILEVLPYHECDLMSRDQPDYLTCLVRLQVQNISARYPIFITETTTDRAFGRNGILTMTVNSFLINSPVETFTV